MGKYSLKKRKGIRKQQSFKKRKEGGWGETFFGIKNAIDQKFDFPKKPAVVKGGTNPPQGEGGTTPPQGEGGTTPPQGEGGTNPPQGEGGKEKEEEKNLHASIRSDPVAREPTNAIVQNKKVEQKQEQEQNRTEQTNVVHVLHNTSKVYIPWSVQNIYIGDKENKYTKVEE